MAKYYDRVYRRLVDYEAMFSTVANFLLASSSIPCEMSANTMFLYPSFANSSAQSPVPAPASRMGEDFLLGAYFLRKCHVTWSAK